MPYNKSGETMQYVQLGNTGLKVSRISLGAMAFGSSKWRPWVLDEAESASILRRALELGINLIDTSNFYSSGESERLIGNVLKDFNRDEVVIATKVGNRLSSSPLNRGYSRKHILSAVDDSLRRLQTDYIDIYQTHVWDTDTNIEEMMEAFDYLIRSGKVLYAGATDMPYQSFTSSIDFARSFGLHSFSTHQFHYNLLSRANEVALIPYCQENGIGLLPYSPMARGLLCGNSTPDAAATIRGKTDDFARKLYEDEPAMNAIAIIRQMADAHEVSMAQVSLAWVLHRPFVCSPILGVTSIDQLNDAVAALELGLAEEEMDALENSVQSIVKE
jgi:1-deoxyxylulose-5-phosphate synthase